MRYSASKKPESEALRRHVFETNGEPYRRSLASAGSPDAGHARHPRYDLLSPPLGRFALQIACRAMGYDRWSEGGLDALEDTAPHPGSVWNRLPDETRADIIESAREHEELTPRELAVKYTDEKKYSVSELSVYRILKAEDLITAPAHIVMKAANEFKDRTTRPNELWQTDVT